MYTASCLSMPKKRRHIKWNHKIIIKEKKKKTGSGTKKELMGRLALVVVGQRLIFQEEAPFPSSNQYSDLFAYLEFCSGSDSTVLGL